MNESFRRYALARHHLHRPVAVAGALPFVARKRILRAPARRRRASGWRRARQPSASTSDAIPRERGLARPLERREDRVAAHLGVPVESPPIQLPNENGTGSPGASRRYSRSSRSPASKRLSSKNQSPCRISSLTLGRSAPHLVRLPEDRDLLGELVLELAALVGRQVRVVVTGQQACDPHVRPQHRPPGRLRRMRGQHELDRDLLETPPELSAGTSASRSNASTSDSRGVSTSSA